ncbi:MAG: hypothetical protein K2X87_16640 [Gemmataceae bacterium]|nr:hypothetical protein [Gemmataceae bacterium]
MRRARRRFVGSLSLATAAVVLAPLVLFLLFAYGPRWPSAFERKYDRVADGMTIEEVRAVLGPESEESSANGLQLSTSNGVVNAVRGERVLVWVLGNEEIRVGFDRGRVVSKHYRDGNYL